MLMPGLEKRALEMILAIYKSQKTGRVVSFPLKDFSSADMGGEFKERTDAI